MAVTKRVTKSRQPLSVSAKAGPSGEVKKVRDRANRNWFARPDAPGDGAERPHTGSAPPAHTEPSNPAALVSWFQPSNAAPQKPPPLRRRRT